MNSREKLIIIQHVNLSASYRKCRFLFLIWMFLLPLVSWGQGDLLVTPRRVVFEGNKQREEIILANMGQDTAAYSISFLQYRMTDDGAFQEITEPQPGELFADRYLRFFPRSVTLAPDESQVIRMQVRRLPNMAEGEAQRKAAGGGRYAARQYIDRNKADSNLWCFHSCHYPDR